MCIWVINICKYVRSRINITNCKHIPMKINLVCKEHTAYQRSYLMDEYSIFLSREMQPENNNTFEIIITLPFFSFCFNVLFLLVALLVWANPWNSKWSGYRHGRQEIHAIKALLFPHSSIHLFWLFRTHLFQGCFLFHGSNWACSKVCCTHISQFLCTIISNDPFLVLLINSFLVAMALERTNSKLFWNDSIMWKCRCAFDYF